MTANGIKIGGLIAGLFFNWIACGGIYHPANPPAATELFPNPYFRVFNFDNVYTDQNGLDDWSAKTNLAFDATIKKFGTHSLFATAGNFGQLISVVGGTPGNSQADGLWFYISPTGVSNANTNYVLFQKYQNTPPTANITFGYRSTNGSSIINAYIIAVKNGLTVCNNTLGALSSGWHYLAYVYNGTTDKLFAIVDNVITDCGVLGGTWGATAFTSLLIETANAAADHGITHTIYADELLFYWNKYLDPNLLVQHYNHNAAWDTSLSRADIAIRPNTDGRVMAGSSTPTAIDHWFDVVNPTVGWFASLAAGWSADAWRTVDFSSVVTAGTKKVKVAAYFTQSAGYLWFNRKYGDSNISNTPNAATEYAKIIGMAASGTNYQADVWELELDANYKTEIACGTASAVLYLSYPKEELRNL